MLACVQWTAPCLCLISHRVRFSLFLLHTFGSCVADVCRVGVRVCVRVCRSHCVQARCTRQARAPTPPSPPTGRGCSQHRTTDTSPFTTGRPRLVSFFAVRMFVSLYEAVRAFPAIVCSRCVVLCACSKSGTTVGRCAGHGAWVLAVAASADGITLASGSSDRTVKLWDQRKQQCLHTFASHDDQVWAVAFSGDGRQLASASDDRSVIVY